MMRTSLTGHDSWHTALAMPLARLGRQQQLPTLHRGAAADDCSAPPPMFMHCCCRCCREAAADASNVFACAPAPHLQRQAQLPAGGSSMCSDYGHQLLYEAHHAGPHEVFCGGALLLQLHLHPGHIPFIFGLPSAARFFLAVCEAQICLVGFNFLQSG